MTGAPAVTAAYFKSIALLFVPLCAGLSWAVAALRADVQSMWSLSRPSTFAYWRLQLDTLLHRRWYAVPEYFVGVAPLLTYAMLLCAASSAIVFVAGAALRRHVAIRQQFVLFLLLHAVLFAGSIGWARVLARQQLTSGGPRDRLSSNQAMQLTASKPDVYAWSVCHQERMPSRMHRGLATADLVSR